MNQNGIPGCVVTDKLLAEITEEAQAPDKGKASRLERAAKMVAMMRGMGFAGAHIGGHGLKYGDCALFDTAFICPMSQCPKGQRNGPCGGSINGWCEVYPEEKECIYVRAYRRLKHYGEEQALEQIQVPPLDYDLRHTSSWLNFYMGRDHTAKQLGIVPPKKRGEE